MVDARVMPGFSGGPTLDLQGNIIGITTAMDNTQQQAALVMPITQQLIQTMLENILSNGKITRNAFGMSAITLNTTIAQQL